MNEGIQLPPEVEAARWKFLEQQKARRARQKKISLIVGIATVVGVVALGILAQVIPHKPTCVELGRGYMKQIDEYPTTSDGQSAELIISEHCSRSSEAYSFGQ